MRMDKRISEIRARVERDRQIASRDMKTHETAQAIVDRKRLLTEVERLTLENAKLNDFQNSQCAKLLGELQDLRFENAGLDQRAQQACAYRDACIDILREVSESDENARICSRCLHEENPAAPCNVGIKCMFVLRGTEEG